MSHPKRRCLGPALLMPPRPLDTVTFDELLPWQADIAKRYMRPAAKFDRSINWYYDKAGNTGKTVLTKYFVDRGRAIPITGCGPDCLHGIRQYVDRHKEGPDVIIFDFPRSVGDLVSYSALEQAKNGLFYSPKYHGTMVRYNTPHVIVFSNQKPDKTKLSLDRWNVVDLSVVKLLSKGSDQ